MWFRSYFVNEIVSVKLGPGTMKTPWHAVAIVSGKGGVAFHYRSAGLDPDLAISGWVVMEYPAVTQGIQSFQSIIPEMTYLTLSRVEYPHYGPENQDGYTTVLSICGFEWASGGSISPFSRSQICALTMPYPAMICLFGLLPFRRLLHSMRLYVSKRRGFEIIPCVNPSSMA